MKMTSTNENRKSGSGAKKRAFLALQFVSFVISSSVDRKLLTRLTDIPGTRFESGVRAF
jgi:hypothetical protein